MILYVKDLCEHMEIDKTTLVLIWNEFKKAIKLFDILILEDSYIDTWQISQKVKLFWNVLTNCSMFFSCQHVISLVSP